MDFPHGEDLPPAQGRVKRSAPRPPRAVEGAVSAKRRAPRLAEAWAEVDSEAGALSLLAPCSPATGSTGSACLRHMT